MNKSRRRKRLSKSAAAAIVTSALAVLFIAALLIVNIFIPVKYLTAYMVKASVNREGELRVTFIDVGFGESILIELPDGKTALIDGGDGAYANRLKVVKTLNSRGIKTLDYLVCTSVKKEHCGSLAEILRYKEVKSAFVPYCPNTRITDEYHAFITALDDKEIQSSVACVGNGFYGEDYFFTFLSPSSYLSQVSEYAAMNSDPDAQNIENASAVGWLEYNGFKFVFTSDVRPDALKRAITDYNLHKQLGEEYCPFEGYSVELDGCTVTTVAGHGGESNAYAPWYELVKPDYAVVSVGENYAGYPSAVALSNPIGVGAELYLTEESGNITFTVNADGLEISAENN